MKDEVHEILDGGGHVFVYCQYDRRPVGIRFFLHHRSTSNIKPHAKANSH